MLYKGLSDSNKGFLIFLKKVKKNISEIQKIRSFMLRLTDLGANNI
jgi:hypothetical protein